MKSTSFNVWVRYFVRNLKGTLWNSTQNILHIHWKIWFLYNIEILELLDLRARTRLWNAPGLCKINVSLSSMDTDFSHLCDHMLGNDRKYTHITTCWYFLKTMHNIKNWPDIVHLKSENIDQRCDYAWKVYLIMWFPKHNNFQTCYSDCL